MDGTAPGRSRIEWRRAIMLVLPVLVVAAAAFSGGEASPRAWLCVAVGAFVGLLGARIRPHETPRTSRPRVWTSAALSLSIASAALTERWASVGLVRNVALLGAGVMAVRAIAVIDGDHGLAAGIHEATASSRTFGVRAMTRIAMATVAFAWGTSAFASGLAWTEIAGGFANVGPLASSAGAAAALFAIGSQALLVGSARRLELEAPPRALACAVAAGLGLVLSLSLALTTSLRSDAATTLGFAVACLAIVRLARAGDTLALARRGRRLLTLAIFGGPVAALAAVAGVGHVPGDGLIALLIALATLAIGALGPRLEEPFLPAKGRLTGALAEATRAAGNRDARAAFAKALSHLRDAVGHGAASPELWTLHPTRIFTTDAAGYLRERAGELPTALLDIARGEPSGIVRVDVLRALEVRRADLRPLLRWLDDRGVFFAILIASAGGEEPDGVILVPLGTRSEPLTIEEAYAAKIFADAFVAVCQADGARERHLGREKVLSDKIEALDDEIAALRHATALDASRNELASARLAQPATVGIYSADYRMAYDSLERRIQNDAPVVLVARAGIDPVPLLARAHLKGPRKDRPLVIVDGTSSREHDLERWRDKQWSPLALADRGRLVLVDGAALPGEIQTLIARALIERRAPWERATPLDVKVALTATSAPDVLVERQRLTPELYACFEDAAAIELPGLRHRAEDLFSIVADRLAREGLRVRGTPLGIDAAAFAHLVDYPFEGEDAELAAIVTRLVARARGDIVRADDMYAIGLRRAGEAAETQTLVGEGNRAREGS